MVTLIIPNQNKRTIESPFSRKKKNGQTNDTYQHDSYENIWLIFNEYEHF